jgi:hypothetical protein
MAQSTLCTYSQKCKLIIIILIIQQFLLTDQIILYVFWQKLNNGIHYGTNFGVGYEYNTLSLYIIKTHILCQLGQIVECF